MKRLFPLLAAALLFDSGCHMFSKKKNPSAPKESKTVATDVEQDFMHRWVDKRAADLAAQGLGSIAAHAQAQAEFAQKYPYTEAAKQTQ